MPVHHKDSTLKEEDTVALARKGLEIFDIVHTPSYHCVCFARFKNNKSVAKFIRYDQFFDHTFRTDRLPKKLEQLRQLDHNYLIKIYQTIHLDYVSIIFMEYCGDGMDLQQLVYLERGLGEMTARYYYRQVGSALAYLHQNESAHCDVRCDNVLLNQDKTVAKLSFLGIQMWKYPPKVRPYYPLIGTFHGSGPYLAPEVLYGRPADPYSCDVWAMGVLLYYTINHNYPFIASNIADMAETQAKGIFNINPKWSNDLKLLFKIHFARAPLMRRSMMRLMSHPWLASD